MRGCPPLSIRTVHDYFFSSFFSSFGGGGILKFWMSADTKTRKSSHFWLDVRVTCSYLLPWRDSIGKIPAPLA